MDERKSESLKLSYESRVNHVKLNTAFDILCITNDRLCPLIVPEQVNIITGTVSCIFIYPHQQPGVKIAAVFL